jgi:ADP-heptose:LPS heptosyltransferase
MQSWRDQKAIRERTRAAKFDRIFCFDTSSRIAGLFDGIKTRFHWFQGSAELKHSARHYLDLVASTCHLPTDEFYNFLPVSSDAVQQVNAELESYDISADDTLLMIHPTFSGYSRIGLRKRQARKRKLWPPQNYGSLGSKLASSKLATGSSPKTFMALLPDELHFGEKIVRHSGNTILLRESQPTFDRYKALISRANALLTPDSGPMHIASALGTRIVAFFSMKDPADCGPYMPSELFTILQSDDPIRGISAISVDTVFDAVMAQLNASV